MADLNVADQPPAVTAAREALTSEFSGLFDGGTVSRFVADSYERLTARPHDDQTLVEATERLARQRLQALARVEAKRPDDRPIVLFMCVHNAGRSQMALGWFQRLAGDAAIAWSGGSEPGSAVNPAAVAAMAEVGIDIAREFPKPWTDEIVRAADVVVTMGCGDACPFFPGTRYEDWALDDPHGQGIDAVRPIRDEIERRVRALLAALGVVTSSH
ncbi:MAG: arsenate reductase ArsC [Acidimicrobiia bacterium]